MNEPAALQFFILVLGVAERWMMDATHGEMPK
jgi:hypothetical protein